MKNYKGVWISKKDMNPEFKNECTCKRCNTSFTTTLTENIEKKDIRIFVKDEEEVRTIETSFFGIWNYYKNVTFEREVYEQVVLHKSVCPTCGKKKKLFYTRYPERKFVYGEWHEDSW
jgi:hypothetical protein